MNAIRQLSIQCDSKTGQRQRLWVRMCCRTNGQINSVYFQCVTVTDDTAVYSADYDAASDPNSIILAKQTKDLPVVGVTDGISVPTNHQIITKCLG